MGDNTIIHPKSTAKRPQTSPLPWQRLGNHHGIGRTFTKTSACLSIAKSWSSVHCFREAVKANHEDRRKDLLAHRRTNNEYQYCRYAFRFLDREELIVWVSRSSWHCLVFQKSVLSISLQKCSWVVMYFVVIRTKARQRYRITKHSVSAGSSRWKPIANWCLGISKTSIIYMWIAWGIWKHNRSL